MCYILRKAQHTRACASLVCQVEAEAPNLNSNDAYLLKTPQGGGYIWLGKGASEEEERGAQYISDVLQCTSQRVTEGQEPGGCAIHRKRHRAANSEAYGVTLMHPDS